MGNVNTAEEPAKTFMASVYIVPKSFFKVRTSLKSTTLGGESDMQQNIL